MERIPRTDDEREPPTTSHEPRTERAVGDVDQGRDQVRDDHDSALAGVWCVPERRDDDNA
jgi:hypothetical protein